jgi:hypothetical protein
MANGLLQVVSLQIDTTGRALLSSPSFPLYYFTG